MGNTLLNLFGELEDIKLASLYTRMGIPEAEISEAFCITESMLVRSFLGKGNPGKRIHAAEDNEPNPEKSKENGLVRFMRVHRWTVFFWLQNLVWKLGRWKSENLEKFVKDYNPDLILTVFQNAGYLNKLTLHVLSLTKAKLVLCAWDNNYSMKQWFHSPLRWIKHFCDRIPMRKVVQKAILFYVISDIQKKEYEKCFKMHCKILTKGADFTELPGFKKEYNNPMQIVYTGNIALNRWKSLKLIADALESINRDGVKAQLRIYTATPLTNKMEKALNRGESSFLMGSVPACEIPEVQKNADMLVHVEAMDLANKLRVRQSFSTKIVDYLKAARPILAVGPREVASIDHLIRYDCAIVSDNKTELEQKLCSILENPSELNRVAANAYECGRKYHNKENIQRMLLQDLKAVCEK